VTRGRLVARTAANFGFDTEAGSEERELMEEWANEGVIDILLETHVRVELGELTLTAGVNDYRVDSSVMAVKEIDPTGGVDAQLVTSDEIYDRRRASDVPDSLFQLAITGDLFQVWPTPSQTQVIKYVYVARPTPMTNDAHDPSQETYGAIPEEFHPGIQAYMEKQAAMYDEKRAPFGPVEYEQAYQAWLVKIRKRTRGKAQRGLNRARIGYPERGIPRRNDVYPER
jgi:hypothetical protein